MDILAAEETYNLKSVDVPSLDVGNSSSDITSIYIKLAGVNSDHAEDQKKQHHLLKQKKIKHLMSHLSTKAYTKLTAEELTHINTMAEATTGTTTIQRLGSEAWNNLTQEM